MCASSHIQQHDNLGMVTISATPRVCNTRMDMPKYIYNEILYSSGGKLLLHMLHKSQTSVKDRRI